MISYTQTLLGPLVAALERTQTRVGELERENGRLQAENEALRAAQSLGATQETASPSEPPTEPSAESEPVSVPWWRRWLAAVYGW